MNEKVLVVDDEVEICDLLEFYLKNEGYIVTKYNNGLDALNAVKKETFDIALLDIMLPEVNGYTITKEIRKNNYYPIIFLTAKVEDMDKIMGLTIGADDYITKPFNPLEMIARVKTQLRRYKQYNHQQEKITYYDIRGLMINKDNHKCSLYGQNIELTPLEFNILYYLCSKQGHVVSSEELFENVWKEKYIDNNNTVMAHIARLREKLNESTKHPKFIKTVWGVGYTIE